MLVARVRSYDGLAMLLSKYVQELSADAKERYLDKVKYICDRDPYEIKDAEWVCFDDVRAVDLIPDIAYEDIVDYLVVRKSAYSSKEFKAMKSLQAHNQLTSGFVREVVFIEPVKEKILSSAKVCNVSALSSQSCIHFQC